MVKELMMGFDCREMWMPEAEAKNWQHDTSYLLKTDIERILSISRAYWRTVFLPPNGKYGLAAANTAPGYNLIIPPDSHTINYFWRDLESLREFIFDHKEEYLKRCWMIGITIVQTSTYLQGIQEHAIRFVQPLEETEPDLAWKLIGYSVEDHVFLHSGLGHNWIEEYQSERRNLWGHKLNQYYLFSRQEDAIEYATWHTTVSPGEGTQLVFGLYLIQEFP